MVKKKKREKEKNNQLDFTEKKGYCKQWQGFFDYCCCDES